MLNNSEKEKMKSLEEEVNRWTRDYWKIKDELDVLKAKSDEFRYCNDRTVSALEREICDLKLLLGGSICKQNPFLEKHVMGGPEDLPPTIFQSKFSR